MIAKKCGLCGRGETAIFQLKRCGRCRVQTYCNHLHQAIHHCYHKEACFTISDRRSISDLVADTLRCGLSNDDLFRDPFKSSVGHFAASPKTKDYLFSRYRLLEALEKVSSHLSIDLQAQIMFQMIELDRSDSMGVWKKLPFAFLRVNMLQEAYGLIRWWTTKSQTDRNAWKGHGLPVSDAWKRHDYLCQTSTDLHFLVATILIKTTLVLDTQDLANRFDAMAPDEMFDEVGANTELRTKTQSDLGKAMGYCFGGADYLSAEIRDLYHVIQDKDNDFWPALMNPRNNDWNAFNDDLDSSATEVQVVVRNCYAAWRETPGALKYIAHTFSSATSGAQMSDLPSSADQTITLIIQSRSSVVASASSNDTTDGSNTSEAASIPAANHTRQPHKTSLGKLDKLIAQISRAMWYDAHCASDTAMMLWNLYQNAFNAQQLALRDHDARGAMEAYVNRVRVVDIGAAVELGIAMGEGVWERGEDGRVVRGERAWIEWPNRERRRRAEREGWREVWRVREEKGREGVVVGWVEEEEEAEWKGEGKGE